MGVYSRADSKFWYLWLERKSGKGIRERTAILKGPDTRAMADALYGQRMDEIAKQTHFGNRLPGRISWSTKGETSRWCYIYFVSDGEAVKIGRTSNLIDRMRNMQVGHRTPLSLLAAGHGPRMLEKEIHRRFRHLRLDREWFSMGEDLKKFIERIAQGYDLTLEVGDLSLATCPEPKNAPKQA